MAGNYQKPEAARRIWFQTSSLQNTERRHFCWELGGPGVLGPLEAPSFLQAAKVVLKERKGEF